MITSINPATGQTIKQYAEHDDAYVQQALDSAVQEQRLWAKKPIAERAAILPRIAAVLRANKDKFAHLITEEMGKPLAEALGEIEKCAWTCEFYASAAPTFLADTPVASPAAESAVVYDPMGVVLAIMPWNYPFWQFVRFAAPAIAAGNGAILKHANNVPACALALEQVFLDAGLPAGLIATVLIDAGRVEALINDDRIAALTMTGSTAVGKIVAAQAGRAMKKQVLELGGADPFIVLKDADIPLAAKSAAKARFSNTGQSCIASKRFIVEEAVADQFVALFCEHVKAIKVGDPLNVENGMGPLARANLRDDLHHQVERSVAAGAVLKMGGKAIDGPGYFYEATILDRVTPDMAAAAEETFGPAAAVIRVKDADHAIEVANATEFGLGASLWTSDLVLAHTLVRRIEAGAVFVNAIVASDARLPFGGIKQSGYGRELGEHGIREFTNIKTVWFGPAR